MISSWIVGYVQALFGGLSGAILSDVAVVLASFCFAYILVVATICGHATLKRGVTKPVYSAAAVYSVFLSVLVLIADMVAFDLSRGMSGASGGLSTVVMSAALMTIVILNPISSGLGLLLAVAHALGRSHLSGRQWNALALAVLLIECGYLVYLESYSG